MVGVTGSIPVAPTIHTLELLLFSRIFESRRSLSAPEQTAHSAQKPGEFGQWLGKVFMQGSLVMRTVFTSILALMIGSAINGAQAASSGHIGRWCVVDGHDNSRHCY